jgi:hypothetical protein
MIGSTITHFRASDEKDVAIHSTERSVESGAARTM